jgi:tetratricopeptide (TPR) repeat protein
VRVTSAVQLVTMADTYNVINGQVPGLVVQADHVGEVNTTVVRVDGQDQASGGGWSVEPPWDRLVHPLRGRDTVLTTLTECVVDLGGQVIVLHGGGGYGKSEVALRLAEEVVEQRVEVWWVSAADGPSLVSALREVAIQAGANPGLVAMAWSGHANAPDLLWRTLRRSATRWLLIIDNADRPEELVTGTHPHGRAGWVRRPMTEHGTVLVTSRNGSADAWGPHATLMRISALTPEDGAQVLLDLAGAQAGSWDEAAALATRLGGLPLALRSAGTYLAATGQALQIPELAVPRTFAAYRAHLDDGFSDLVDAVPPGQQSARSDRELLTRTCELSLDLLDARGLPLARPLLRLLARFGPAPVLEDMLVPSVLRRLPELAGLTPEILLGTLHELLNLNLLDRTTGQDGDGVALHPVVREILRDGTDRAAKQHAVVLVALLEELTGALDPEQPTNWRRWQSLLPHCLATVPDDPTDLATRRPGRSTTPKAARQSDSPTWQATAVLGRAARYCEAIGQFDLSVPLYRRVRSACRELLGEQHNDALIAQTRLAEALVEQGAREEALREYRTLERIRRAALGAVHPDTLLAQFNIALLTRRPEDFAVVVRGARTRAQQEANEIADLRREFSMISAVFLPSAALPGQLPARSLLARVLADSGELTAAEVEYRTLVDYHTDRSGPRDERTLAARVNLAAVLYEKGEMEAAEAELHAVYGVRRALLGERDLAVVSVRQSRATIYDAMGEFAAALAEAEAVLEAQREMFGPNHPTTLRTQAKRAAIMSKTADGEAANRELREVQQELERTLGELHPETLIIRSYRAEALLSWGEVKAAEAEYRAVLDGFRTSLGDHHPDTLLCRRFLADVLAHQGNVSAARAEYHAVLAGQRVQLRPENWQTKLTQARLEEGAD